MKAPMQQVVSFDEVYHYSQTEESWTPKITGKRWCYHLAWSIINFEFCL